MDREKKCLQFYDDENCLQCTLNKLTKFHEIKDTVVGLVVTQEILGLFMGIRFEKVEIRCLCVHAFPHINNEEVVNLRGCARH